VSGFWAVQADGPAESPMLIEGRQRLRCRGSVTTSEGRLSHASLSVAEQGDLGFLRSRNFIHHDVFSCKAWFVSVPLSLAGFGADDLHDFYSLNEMNKMNEMNEMGEMNGLTAVVTM
jgi:hypothetical protein